MVEQKYVWCRVMFTIKTGGERIRYAKDCFALGKADAIITVSTEWYENHKNHMYYVEAFRMTKLAMMDTHFLKEFTVISKGGK